MTRETGALDAALRAAIRDVPDFPKPGILFRDITGVLADAALLRRTVQAMAAPFANDRVTHVAGIESRGFILGAPVAIELKAGFVPLRKPGKLPAEVRRVDYALEYGSDALEVRRDALRDAHRVLLVDDVLATGGTARAACELIGALGAQLVGCSFLLELSALRGRDRLGGIRLDSVMSL